MNHIIKYILSLNTATVCAVISSIGTVVAAIAAVVAARAAVKGANNSVSIYKHTVIRETKLQTIVEFSRIRNAYPNLSPEANNPVDDEIRKKYLSEMERFCTGINSELYDIKILKRMSGIFLITQYDKHMKNFIDKRNSEKANSEKFHCEYIKTIEGLKKLEEQERSEESKE